MDSYFLGYLVGEVSGLTSPIFRFSLGTFFKLYDELKDHKYGPYSSSEKIYTLPRDNLKLKVTAGKNIIKELVYTSKTNFFTLNVESRFVLYLKNNIAIQQVKYGRNGRSYFRVVFDFRTIDFFALKRYVL